MEKTPFCPSLPATKAPIDGWGPRGVPDCYHIPLTLNSTFRYARFVKKLRQLEEEQRKGQLNNLQKLRDQQVLDFFTKCDHRSLINNVSRRVELCMQSYQEDLEKKKQRLTEMLKGEEEDNIRRLILQAQEAKEAQWQVKMDRLQYLLEKRKREHEAKYGKIPLSKCVHVKPCIVKLRKKESSDFQLYQIEEKKSIKMQQLEMDKMWNEVAMKESDALAARMEVDAIERYRRDMMLNEDHHRIFLQRQRQKELDRENLKREQLAIKEKVDADSKKEKEEKEYIRQKSLTVARERNEQIAERQEVLKKQGEDERLINDTWASFGNQSLKADQDKIALIRRKKVENNECNAQLVELKKQLDSGERCDSHVREVARAQQDAIDKRRCGYLAWSRKLDQECRKSMVEVIQENADKKNTKEISAEQAYYDQLNKQTDELIVNKAKEDAKTRKQHQKDILKQIEYNQLLKERALEEEMMQRKKAEIVSREYMEEIGKMLHRDFFSNDIHPFLKQMVKMKKTETCTCSKPTFCKK